MDQIQIYRTKGACAYLGISRSAFLKLIADGMLPKGIKLIPGGKAVGWRASELNEFLEARETESRKSI